MPKELNALPVSRAAIEYKSLKSLTSLRFFAAVCVVFNHANEICVKIPAIKFISNFGWLGVSLFFILSGFVLMWSFDPAIGATQFILRRLTRIYPLHFACLTISLLLFLMTGIGFGGYVGTIAGTIANFFLVHDWLPGHPEIRQAWNGVSWTLSCEFFFYITAPVIFPFLVHVGKRQHLKKILVFGLSWCLPQASPKPSIG